MSGNLFRVFTVVLGCAGGGLLAAQHNAPAEPSSYAVPFQSFVKPEPIQPGKFSPDWNSLKQYQVPEWFRDAKFGIWAHWGPQCQPEQGGWYARTIYLKGNLPSQRYGDLKKVGFKEVINDWKAEKWDPNRLVELYKRVGAQYFFAMANHHDNMDLWDSKYQPWNSVNMGPKKDLIAGWAEAARKQGLRFGVSVHAAHAWSWYEPAQDFDGKLTKADGKGTWWEGYDPQNLYEQNHVPGADYRNAKTMGAYWDWGNGCSQPDRAYCERFYNRTMDLINKYRPDMVYFDDSVLPLYPVSDLGLAIAAHLYNSSMQWQKERTGILPGNADAVLFGKKLDDKQRQCLVWDIERGVSSAVEPFPWQTDTCIGSWHYKRAVYTTGSYKSAKTVIQMLVDIVSKNGNLLLNIPVRGDGSIDDKEEALLEDIAAWMDVNKECIFGTRPWKIFGEGAAYTDAPLKAAGFNEGKGKAFTAADIRFTTKGDVLYVIALGRPDKQICVKSLGSSSSLMDKKIQSVQLVNSAVKISWEQKADGLVIEPPADGTSDIATVFKLVLK